MQGGIDGFSRFVFLTCNNNKKSDSVFQLFEKAIHEYGVPDRIRTDKGGENIKVVVCGVRKGDCGWSGDMYNCICLSIHRSVTGLYRLLPETKVDPEAFSPGLEAANGML